jgi:hypothetical protein
VPPNARQRDCNHVWAAFGGGTGIGVLTLEQSRRQDHKHPVNYRGLLIPDALHRIRNKI